MQFVLSYILPRLLIDNGSILVHETVGASDKMFFRFRGPPGRHFAIFVKGTALTVKVVSQLMTNGCANCAEI